MTKTTRVRERLAQMLQTRPTGAGLLLLYLVVLGGDWRRWRDHLRLSLRVTVICSGVRRLVPSISCSRSGCCHGNGCGPRYSNRGCCGSVGCCHSVCCHRRLVNSVTGHCGRMCVRHPSCWLMTDNRGKNDIISKQTTASQPELVSWGRRGDRLSCISTGNACSVSLQGSAHCIYIKESHYEKGATSCCRWHIFNDMHVLHLTDHP